jgi:hypothetical protein
MIAARRSDVAALNAEARTRMIEAGRLHGDPLEVAGRPFCKGDLVMTTRNNTPIGVDNGTLAEVTAVDHDRRTVTLETHDGALVTLPRPYVEAGHLTHAYAVTGHKSQGMTTDRTFVLVDETLYREWGYVAMSRGRTENRLYVVAGVDLDREDTGGQVARAADPMPALTRALGRSRAKELALDSWEAEELKGLSEAELQREQALLGRVAAAAPPDPSCELDQVARRSAQVEALLAREQRIEDEVAARLDEMGATARFRRRAEAAVLRDRIEESRGTKAELTRDLGQLVAEERRLRASLADHHAWGLENAPLVRRLRVVERELASRYRGREVVSELGYEREAPFDGRSGTVGDLSVEELRSDVPFLANEDAIETSVEL